MSETDVTAPKIEFPCPNYPIKIVGVAGDGFQELVIELVSRHAPELDPAQVVIRDSSQGRFVSVQVLITATGVEQLQAIHDDLRATGRVHLVL